MGVYQQVLMNPCSNNLFIYLYIMQCLGSCPLCAKIHLDYESFDDLKMVKSTNSLQLCVEKRSQTVVNLAMMVLSPVTNEPVYLENVPKRKLLLCIQQLYQAFVSVVPTFFSMCCIRVRISLCPNLFGLKLKCLA